MDPSTEPFESPAIVSASPPICRIVTSLILCRSKKARSARSVTAPNLVMPTSFPPQAANLRNLWANHERLSEIRYGRRDLDDVPSSQYVRDHRRSAKARDIGGSREHRLNHDCRNTDKNHVHV